jgi:tetratricopeptide (TPR) repeat protein
MTLTKAERELHAKTMARCFNEAWEYLEKKDRNAHDDQRMLNLAHTARFHSSLVGTPRNHAISDWQISRVYAALHEHRLALEFARSALEACEMNGLSDILCTAYEAMARAFTVANDRVSAQNYITKARDQLDITSADPEDREIYIGQIRETEKLLRRTDARSSSVPSK